MSKAQSIELVSYQTLEDGTDSIFPMLWREDDDNGDDILI